MKFKDLGKKESTFPEDIDFIPCNQNANDNDKKEFGYAFQQRNTDVNLLVFHYVVRFNDNYNDMLNYFKSGILNECRKGQRPVLASVNFFMGRNEKEGYCAMLPLNIMPITSGGSKIDKGQWIDKNYNLTYNVNGISLSVETFYSPKEKFTEYTYDKLSVITKWWLENYEHSKIWNVADHRTLCPFVKQDLDEGFSWEYFFVNKMGVTKTFFDKYLSWRDEVKTATPERTTELRHKYLQIYKEELKGKNSSIAFE